MGIRAFIGAMLIGFSSSVAILINLALLPITIHVGVLVIGPVGLALAAMLAGCVAGAIIEFSRRMASRHVAWTA